MRLLAVEKLAKSKGILDTCKYTKKELIRIIQKTEGNSDCFANGRKTCPEIKCTWRIDCLK